MMNMMCFRGAPDGDGRVIAADIDLWA